MAQSKSISAFFFALCDSLPTNSFPRWNEFVGRESQRAKKNLLFVILSQQIHSIEGRHLRVGKNNNKSQTLQTQTKIYETETIKHGGELHGEDITNEATLVSPPTPPSLGVSQSQSRSVNDFRSTPPGHSPGVGHCKPRCITVA
ncbi:precursor of CEP3-like [Fagus crenata]